MFIHCAWVWLPGASFTRRKRRRTEVSLQRKRRQFRHSEMRPFAVKKTTPHSHVFCCRPISAKPHTKNCQSSNCPQERIPQTRNRFSGTYNLLTLRFAHFRKACEWICESSSFSRSRSTSISNWVGSARCQMLALPQTELPMEGIGLAIVLRSFLKLSRLGSV